jgi:hypothetical protein
MELACNNCKKRNTKVVSARKLSKLFKNSDNRGKSVEATAMLLSPSLPGGKIDSKILPDILKIAKSTLEWLKKREEKEAEKVKLKGENERNVIVCFDCGHWERI